MKPAPLRGAALLAAYDATIAAVAAQRAAGGWRPVPHAQISGYLGFLGYKREAAWSAHCAARSGLPHDAAAAEAWRRAVLHGLLRI